MATAKELLTIARKELGNTESPAASNRTKYGKWYGMNGVPWCMIFVQWCFSQAGIVLPLRTASCGELMRAAKAAGIDRATATSSGRARFDPASGLDVPIAGSWVTRDFQPGDVVIYDFPGGAATDHCGIVELELPDYGVQAIEGNTSQSGSQSNGGMVCRKSRPAKYIVGAVRPRFDAEKEDDMDITQITDKQAYELLMKAQRYAAQLPEPAWSQAEGCWQRAIDAGVINGGSPEGLLKRDEFAAVMGRRGLL